MKNQTKTSKNARGHYRRGWWSAVAVCVVGLVAALPPDPVLAGQTPLILDLSLNIGPIAAQFDITKPVAQPATGVFRSTLHIHARDDTQTPAFNGYLVAIGEAADPDTLVGGFLPASLIILKDVAAGMNFQQAAADAQAKTGVTVTFLNDPGLTEYALILALIAIIAIAALTLVQPGAGLSNQLCTIHDNIKAGLAAGGFSNPPDPCATPPPNLIP